MKYLNDSQLKKLSYEARRNYYQQVKDFKFGNIKEGTPLVYYSRSGKIIIFKYRKTGGDVPNMFGFSEYVYGQNSSLAYLPTEVEIASIQEIDVFIARKKIEFENCLKTYESYKELINAD